MRSIDLLSTCTFILLVMLFTSRLSAQQNRYWINNFDKESFLLSGAVVGGGTSLGSIYYNPANVSYIKDNQLSLNSLVVSIELYRLENALGTNFPIKITQLIFKPSYVSYVVKSKKNPKLAVELAILTHEDSEFEVQEGVKGTLDLLMPLEGLEAYDATFTLANRFTSVWAGAGFGYQLGESLSVGFSHFFLFKSSRYKNILDVSAFPITEPVLINGEPNRYFVSNTLINEVNQTFNAQMRWKFGMTYKANNWGIGLNITTPTVNVLSSAKASITAKSTNLLDSTGVFTKDFILSDQQQKLKSNYKDPFSIALGLSYIFPNRKWELYYTMEYFARILPYKVIKAEPGENITSEENQAELESLDILSSYQGNRALVNVAVGLKHLLSNGNFIMGGFRTDLNYSKSVDYTGIPRLNQPPPLDYNVYHFTTGYQFRFKRASLVFGLQYSYGNEKDLESLVNISDPSNGDGPLDPPLLGARQNNMSIFYNAISIFIGFSFQ